jgi:hypothetical protein
MMAKLVKVKFAMEGTDQKTGDKGSLVVNTDMWIGPKVAGYDEMREFHKKMAEKIAWFPSSSIMTMGRQDMAKAMAEAYKEAGKMEGVPLLQVMRMSAEGTPANSGGQQAQQQQQPRQEQQAQAPSVGGALGSAIGGRFGGLGRLGRKKKEEPQQEQPQQPPAEQNAGQPAQGSGDASLLEMTIESSNFSSAPVDASKFEVPAGFKKVDSDLRRMQR